MMGEMKLHRWFWAWEFDKEERWLNEMSMSGWALKRVGLCTYTFEESEKGAYIIRLGLMEKGDGCEELACECGAEYLGNVNRWQFFRKRAEEGTFELYSDLDSRIAHLNRIARMLGALGGANLCIGIANSLTASHLGWINLLCATLLMYALGRVTGMKDALVGEREIRE